MTGAGRAVPITAAAPWPAAWTRSLGTVTGHTHWARPARLGLPSDPPCPQCCPPLCCAVVPVFQKGSCPKELTRPLPWWCRSRDVGDTEHRAMGSTGSATTPAQPRPQCPCRGGRDMERALQLLLALKAASSCPARGFGNRQPTVVVSGHHGAGGKPWNSWRGSPCPAWPDAPLGRGSSWGW